MDNPIEHLIATAKPRTAEVPVCGRGDLVASHRQLVYQLRDAVSDDTSLEGSDDAARQAIAEQIVAVEAEMEASRVTITVQSIGGRWADLLRDNPPTGDQRLLGYDNNPDTFQPAAIAACAIKAESAAGLSSMISLEQATKMRQALDEGEWGNLYSTVQQLNRSRMPNPKLVAATELLRPNEPSSTTSALEGSLEDGS